MKPKEFNWDEIAKNFDEVERKLLENYEDLNLEAFFEDFHEKFTQEKGVEKKHILEAKERITKILKIIDDLKKKLIAEKATLTENRKKFTKYNKASVLENK